MAASLISAIALDLGTTSVKAGLLDNHGKMGTVYAEPAPVVNVAGHLYESDALAYLKVATLLLERCVTAAGAPQLLGICCQRSSFLIWDKSSGLPVTQLISWQDSRGAKVCDALQGKAGLIQTLSGLRLTPYFLAPKLKSLLHEQPDLRSGLSQGTLLVGTLDSYLVWHWSGWQYHQIDVSMAARTLLMDLQHKQWSAELCEIFTISPQLLPEIKPSVGLDLELDNGLVLQACLADQSAALIASVRDERPEAIVNLGTGGFVVRYFPEQRRLLNDGYLRTLVYQDSALKSHLAVEGTLNSIASALAPYPFRECRVENLAQLENYFCLSEPSGIGAPFFREGQGVIFSQAVEQLSKHQIACLLLEGIIFRVALILEDFHRMQGIERVYLSGGLSAVPALQQGIACCIPFECHRLLEKESSLLGTALLAAGLPQAHHRKTELVKITTTRRPLQDKYQSWKTWFGSLLNS